MVTLKFVQNTMAHPKRKISTTRRDKRRTHQKLSTPHFTKCKKTGELHLSHHALFYKGDLYYKGLLILKGKKTTIVEGAT